MGLDEYRVIFSSSAKASLKDIIDYLSRKASRDIAEKVRKELLRFARSLSYLPQRHQEERLLSHLNGNIRSVTRWSYKIVYEIKEMEVHILYIFHTSRDPQDLGT